MSCLLRLRGVFALILVCGFAAELAAAPRLLIVDLYLNDQHQGDTFVLQEDDGEFFIAEQHLREWQIVHPWPSVLIFRGKKYYALGGFAGTSAELDQRTLELRVAMPASLMPVRTVDLAKSDIRPTIEDFGAYLDYDVNWLANDSTGQRSVYGLVQPVVFGSFGNVVSKLSYRDNSGGNFYGDFDEGEGLKVLELTYTRDDPVRMRSLRIGDVITFPGTQGRALRLGGLQIATNFETQPAFIRYPLPSFFGETTVPTALDVYINGQLRRSEQVEAGRYVLEDIPAVNGAGQMQVVTRDALGRQQVFAQDFYLSTELLREGLSEYSINLGALREEYGLENFQYGDIAGTANWRYGWREDITLEGHGEFTNGLGMLGGAFQYAAKFGGTIKAGLGVSHGDSRTGTRWQLGYRQQASVLSYSLDVSGSSRDFSLVGNYVPLPKVQLLASAGKNLYDFGSIGISVIHQSFHDNPNRMILSATHSKTFRNFLSLSTFISAINAETKDFTAGIRISMPFGDYHSAGGGVSTSRDNARLEADVRKSLPIGNGYGYHVGVSASDSSFVDAGIILQNEIGRYTADVRSSENAGTVWQMGSTGSIAYLSGLTKPTRQIRDAFAVVNVGGFEGVRVYAENQEIGRTDENGQLFVPGLRPYLGNQLRIELDDLPLNARVGNINTRAAPFYRSGVVVNFDVSMATNVLLRAILPNGSPLPEGAIASINRSDYLFPVGMDGKLYLQGIDRSSEVEIRWNGSVCDIDVPFPSGDAVIAKMGDIVCEPRKGQ
jgi:outer membrane usher protein